MNVTREELVQYAVEYTSFYAEKYAGANLQDGKSLPILTKEEAAHAGVSIISREYYTKLGTPEVKSAYTSGSTGISLEALFYQCGKRRTAFFTLAVPAEILWDQYRCKIFVFLSCPERSLWTNKV